MQQASSLDYRSQPDNRALDHIPGTDGLPYLGCSLDVVRDLKQVALMHREKWGDVSRVNMLGQRGVMLAGADNYQRVYLDRDQNFSAEMGYLNNLGAFYKGGLLLRDFDDHRFQRRIMQSAFKNAAMKNYVGMMNPMMAQAIRPWGDEKNFVLFPHIKQLLLDVGANVFLGIEDMGTEGQVVNDAFIDISEGLLGLVRKDWPFTRFRRGQRGKALLEQWFARMIPERREGNGKDMLTYMCQEKTETGEYFRNEDLVGHGTFLLFAAHDTTTSVLLHLAMYLGRDQALQERIREESRALGKPQLDYEDLENMEAMELAFHETLRLHPSVPMMTRRTIRECEMGGYTLPANTMVFLPGMINHYDPTYWTNPESFDMDRFSASRAEHKNHSFCYHPFGGGAHKCIGMHFANMLMKCFLHQFLLNYRIRTPDNYNPRLEWVPLPKPGDGVPLTLERIR